MTPRFPFAVIVMCASLLASVSGRSADMPDREQLSLSEFGMNFDFSHIWDSCGDRENGRTIRRALLDELGKCPIEDGKKQSMLQNGARHEALFESEMDAYLAEHGQFPEKLHGFTQTCAELFDMPHVVEARRNLQRYRAGEIGGTELSQKLQLWRCHLKTAPSP